MPDRDQQRIADYYNRLVDQYGYDPRACDASGAKSLEVRYKVLSEVADLTGKSVLEVGCGFGDLGVYLKKRYKGIQYTGIDISSLMIKEGRKANPELFIYPANVLDLDQMKQFDIVLAQGIFYLLGDSAETKMYGLIEKMFALAREAVAFCTLSTWSKKQNRSEFYADPIDVVNWCQHLTQYIVLRHDYNPGDFAVYLYRGGNLNGERC